MALQRTIGEMWVKDGLMARLWILAPLVIVVGVLGGILLSALTNNGWYFVLSYPLSILYFLVTNSWFKRQNKAG